MELNGVERAPARTEDFARLAAEIDKSEEVAWNRIGGPTSTEFGAIRQREGSLPVPATVADWQWLARRLARAVVNGWSAEATAPLLRLAEAKALSAHIACCYLYFQGAAGYVGAKCES